jgi:uncharacterized membrane protein YhaH (DUF805 family)
MLKKIRALFEGKLNRTQYSLRLFIFSVILLGYLTVGSEVIDYWKSIGADFLVLIGFLLYLVAAFISPLIAISFIARRLRDIGFPARYSVLYLVAIILFPIGLLVVVALCLIPGKKKSDQATSLTNPPLTT